MHPILFFTAMLVSAAAGWACCSILNGYRVGRIRIDTWREAARHYAKKSTKP